MKKLLVLIFSISILSFGAFAQRSISVDVIPQPIGQDALRTYTVEIPQTTLNDVEKDWVRYLRKDSRGKSVLVDGVHQQSGVFNRNISAYSFTVHSRLVETSGDVRLTAWLSQNNEKSAVKESGLAYDEAVQKYLRDFAIMKYKQAIVNKLKVEQDKQVKLENELSVLIKDNERALRKISANDRSNKRAREAIETNNTDIQNTSYKIEDQKYMVETTASDANATRGAKRTLSNLEDDKKDLQQKNEIQGKNMDSRKEETREEERKITNLQQAMALKAEDLERQKLLVFAVQTKLDNIK